MKSWNCHTVTQLWGLGHFYTPDTVRLSLRSKEPKALRMLQPSRILEKRCEDTMHCPWLANVPSQEAPGDEYLQAKSASFLALNSRCQEVTSQSNESTLSKGKRLPTGAPGLFPLPYRKGLQVFDQPTRWGSTWFFNINNLELKTKLLNFTRTKHSKQKSATKSFPLFLSPWRTSMLGTLSKQKFHQNCWNQSESKLNLENLVKCRVEHYELLLLAIIFSWLKHLRNSIYKPVRGTHIHVFFSLC